jgi:hypothetical protein
MWKKRCNERTMVGWFLVRISGILVGFGILAVAFWGFYFLDGTFLVGILVFIRLSSKAYLTLRRPRYTSLNPDS